MIDSLVFDVPMELGLELMLPICTDGVNFPAPNSTGQVVDSMSAQYSIDRCIADSNRVMSLQIPNDPYRTQVIRATQVQNLLDNLRGYCPGKRFFNGWLLYQAGLAILLVGFLPSIKRGPDQPKIAAGFPNISAIVSVSQDFQPALNFSSSLSIVQSPLVR